MQQQIDQLAETLAEQLELYNQVLQLLEHEHEALVSARPDAVLDLVRRKETVLLRIRTLDESRLLVLSRLARQWGLKPSAITFEDVERHAKGCDLARLTRVRGDLRQCLERVHRANETNSRACQNGSETIRRILESAARDAAGTANAYGPQAAPTGQGSRAHAAYGVPVRVRTVT